LCWIWPGAVFAAALIVILPRRSAVIARFGRRSALLVLVAALAALSGCGDDQEARLKQLTDARVITLADAQALRADLAAGGAVAAEARFEIGNFSKSREALRDANFGDLPAALSTLEALRAAGVINAQEAARLQTGLASVWDAPAVSAAARRIAWLESRKEQLRAEPDSKGGTPATSANGVAPDVLAVNPNDAQAAAIRALNSRIQEAVERGSISPALAEAMRQRAAVSAEGRVTIEARLARLLAAIPAPVTASAPAPASAAAPPADANPASQPSPSPPLPPDAAEPH
jgi:hypothetical protein